MKRVFVLSLIISMMGCASTSKLSNDGQAEKAFVAEFVRLMIDDQGSEVFRNYISPQFCVEQEIELAAYLVNSYLPIGFEMESYETKTGETQVLIWGDDRVWTHRLYFQVRKEKGKLFLVPSKLDEEYIDPWQKVDRYLDEKG